MKLLPLRARRLLRRTFAPDREHRVAFLIAGAQKGGTNTLDYWLRSHPAVAMAERKEVRYFNDDRLHRNGHPDYAYYHAWFARNAFQRLTGEASPIYIYWKPAIARIHQYNPAMKFILLLRDPVDRQDGQGLRYSRRPRGHAPAQGRGVDGGAHADLRIGPRGVGKVRERQDRQRRRGVHPDRPVGASCEDRTMERGA
jgi:hypothetical protein